MSRVKSAARYQRRNSEPTAGASPWTWFEEHIAPDEPASPRRTWRTAVFVFVIICQAATLLVTWSAWQVREAPPNLPLLPLPQVSLAPVFLLTLLAMFFWPRPAVIAHFVLLAVGCLLDQYRLQPQYIMLAALGAACAFPQGRHVGRWFLATTWLWTGLHKFLSPEWMGPVPWTLLQMAKLQPEPLFMTFAYVVAVSEVALGLLALLRPKIAAVAAVAFHLGIVVYLSPLLADWNVSVFPWNLALAAVAMWALWTDESPLPRTAVQWAFAAALCIYPAGFYLGWTTPRLSHVLYSGATPDGYMTDARGGLISSGMDEMKVSLPATHRALHDYFAAHAPTGAKLQIADPRALVDDAFYLKTEQGVKPLTKEQYLSDQVGLDKGRLIERREVRFWLERAGAGLLRDKGAVSMIHWRKPDNILLSARLLADLPNLDAMRVETDGDGRWLRVCPEIEKLDLLDVQGPLQDKDLAPLADSPELKILRLNNSQIRGPGLKHLAQAPKLEHLELAGAPLEPGALENLRGADNLQRLSIDNTPLSADDLFVLGELPALTHVSFRDAPLTDQQWRTVGARLPHLRWRR